MLLKLKNLQITLNTLRRTLWIGGLFLFLTLRCSSLKAAEQEHTPLKPRPESDQTTSQACWHAQLMRTSAMVSMFNGKKPAPATPPPGTPGPVATVDYKTFKQGEDGACWIGAAVTALAFQRPEDVKRMIGDLSAQSAGMFGVTLPGFPNICRLVYPNAADAKTTFASDSNWARVIHLGLVSQLGENTARHPKTVGWSKIIKYLTGNDPVNNSNFLGFGFQTPGTSETVQMKLAKANDKKIVLASTANRTPTGNAAAALAGELNDIVLMKGHVYAVLAYDQAADRIRLRNPWGNDHVPAARTNAGWGPGEFWMTVAEYEENMEVMAYEK